MMVGPSRTTQSNGCAVGIVRIAAVLPVPAQAAGGRGVGAEDASIERLYAALVLRPVPIDFWHGCERVSSLGASVELYRDGRLIGRPAADARAGPAAAAAVGGGGARLGCAVPTGAFHGLVGAPTPARSARAAAAAAGRLAASTARERDDGPRDLRYARARERDRRQRLPRSRDRPSDRRHSGLEQHARATAALENQAAACVMCAALVPPGIPLCMPGILASAAAAEAPRRAVVVAMIRMRS